MGSGRIHRADLDKIKAERFVIDWRTDGREKP